jgi:hypothetical protein
MIFYGGRFIIKSRTGLGHLKIVGGGLFTAMMHFRNRLLTDVFIAFSALIFRAAD